MKIESDSNFRTTPSAGMVVIPRLRRFAPSLGMTPRLARELGMVDQCLRLGDDHAAS